MRAAITFDADAVEEEDDDDKKDAPKIHDEDKMAVKIDSSPADEPKEEKKSEDKSEKKED